MLAKTAARFIRAFCQVHWPNDMMESTVATDQFSIIDNAVDSGSHKYIPAERLSTDLGMEPGNGVWGYRKYSDGSYLLLTCNGGLAIWDGNHDHAAELGK